MFFCFFILSFVAGYASKIGVRVLISSTPPSHYYSLTSVRQDLAGCDQRFNVSDDIETNVTVSRIRRFLEIQSQIRTLENVNLSIDERASRSKTWLALEDQRVRVPVKLFSEQLWQEWSEVDAAH